MCLFLIDLECSFLFCCCFCCIFILFPFFSRSLLYKLFNTCDMHVVIVGNLYYIVVVFVVVIIKCYCCCLFLVSVLLVIILKLKVSLHFNLETLQFAKNLSACVKRAFPKKKSLTFSF